MQRVLAVLVAALAVACTTDGAPDSTVETSTTVAPTTTTETTLPTTTTLHELRVEGSDPLLDDLVARLYSGGADPGSIPAPPDVVESFSTPDAERPRAATSAVAEWDEEVRLGVVEAGEDVTLAVADPDWRIVGGWWPSVNAGVELGDFPKLVAVVGSDARSATNRETARADSIHFLGLDEEGSAGIVGVPRDSWVSIPGAGHSKINASLAFGGPEMMMDTFAELTGLDFDGYVLTGFEGFRGLIGVLGGLAMDVPRSFNDRWADAYITAGEQILEASEALALSRVRKTIPGGDFQRQEHGGMVMMAAQAMAAGNGPLALPETLAAARAHVSTDLDPVELLRLAATVIRVDREGAVNVVAPGGLGSAGGASVVFLGDEAETLWEDLADGSLEPPE